MTALSKVLSENISYIESRLPVGTSFDFMTRRLLLGETPCYFIGINGFCKTEVLQQILGDNSLCTRNRCGTCFTKRRKHCAFHIAFRRCLEKKLYQAQADEQ